MNTYFHYAPVTEAIAILTSRGFTIDFNIRRNGLLAVDDTFAEEDFDIVDVYRYEGFSDPGDEATVYAIIAKSGRKGILVTGHGNNSGDFSTAMLRRMRYGSPGQRGLNCH